MSFYHRVEKRTIMIYLAIVFSIVLIAGTVARCILLIRMNAEELDQDTRMFWSAFFPKDARAYDAMHRDGSNPWLGTDSLSIGLDKKQYGVIGAPLPVKGLGRKE